MLKLAFASALAVAVGLSAVASRQDRIYAWLGSLFGRGKKDSAQ